MFLRFARCIGRVAAAVAITMTMAMAVTFAVAQPSGPQTAAPAAAAKPEGGLAAPAAPAAPTQIAPEGITPQPGDAFGEDTTLTAKPMLYVKGSGTWDKAFATIANALKRVRTYMDKEGLKADGLPMTIFTATDDQGFDYEAAIPVAEPPKSALRGGIAVGETPEGHALKFVHRGSYDALDDTYEAITNYLDEKRLDAKDMFIEQYVTDPVSADENKLVVNVYVPLK